jgi:glyoxylase-like metal-dependent hydrolase (beta-lactamase superfamily II)
MDLFLIFLFLSLRREWFMKKHEVESQEKELTGEGITRRSFIKGMAASAAGVAVAGILPGYSAMAASGGAKITKAKFVSKIVNYFNWPHPSEYNDIWKAPLKQFKDVKTTDKYGKQIECAYEQGIIGPDASGNFYPNSHITRQDAAVVLVKAFKIPESNVTVRFSDNYSIRKDTLGSVNALVNLGLMYGKTDTLFAPDEYITKEELDETFKKITSSLVAPVQALPVTNATAPRRYVKLYTPTPGAKIYYTTDGTEPNAFSKVFEVEAQGHIMEMIGSRGGDSGPVPEKRDVVYKAFAVKNGMLPSSTQTFTWHLYRPAVADFQHLLIQEKTKTSPAVYQLCNDSESVRAMAWYIEGQDRGVLLDALQTPAAVKNLKDYIDINIAKKPYSVVIGHEHGDHDAQAPNFLKAGVPVYLNKRGWSAVAVAGAFPALISTAEEQAKVKNVEEGDVFDLGGCKLHVYALPGHAHGNVVLQDKENGLIFSSDIYGCTRAGSADNVGVQGVKADLLLSFAQQTYSNYKKDGGKTDKLFTGHDESPLADRNLRLFEAALQQVIDKGEAGCTPTLRSNDAPRSRTTLIGDMWEDGTNWIALKINGIMGDNTEYLTKNEQFNYNGPNGYLKYSVLSNIEITGGELVGKTVQWAPAGKEFDWAGKKITVENSLPNKFDPWSYDYTINVPKANNSISMIPTTMSTKVKSITVNGTEVGYRSSCRVLVADGSVITIRVVAPDNVTTSTYKFTVVQK